MKLLVSRTTIFTLFMVLFLLASRLAFAASVSCDSSDGLPDNKTASDGSECSTDGDGTAPVKAHASGGGFASASGFDGGDAFAKASGLNSSANAIAQANGSAKATAKSGGSSDANAVTGNATAVSATNGDASCGSVGNGAICKAVASRDGDAEAEADPDNSTATAIADTSGAAEADAFIDGAVGSTVKAVAVKDGAAQAFCADPAQPSCMENVKASNDAAAVGSDTGTTKVKCDISGTKNGKAKVTGTGGNCKAPK